MSANAQTSGSGGLSAHDQLPPRLRLAMAKMPLNMSAEYALSQLRSGISEDSLIAQLERLANEKYSVVGVKPLRK